MFYTLSYLALALSTIWILYQTNLRLPLWITAGIIAVGAAGYSIASDKEHRKECLNTIGIVILTLALLGGIFYGLGRSVEILIGTTAKFFEVTCILGFACFIVGLLIIFLLSVNLACLFAKNNEMFSQPRFAYASLQFLLSAFISISLCGAAAYLAVPLITGGEF